MRQSDGWVNVHVVSIGSQLVRNGPFARSWTAELLEDDSGDRMPKPFAKPEHRFPSLEAILDWLGGAQIERDRAEV